MQKIWKFNGFLVPVLFFSLTTSVAAKNNAYLEAVDEQIGFENNSRLQIKLTTNDDIDVSNTNIRAIKLCKQKHKDCKIALGIQGDSNDSISTEHVFTDVVTSPGDYRFIHFMTGNNLPKINDNPEYKLTKKVIKLPSAITLEKELTYNLFIDLDLKKQNKKNNRLIPNYQAFSVTGPAPDEVVVVSENASSDLTFDGGFSAHFPSSAVIGNTVFSVEVDREKLSTGSLYMYPESGFNQDVTVKVKFDPRDREEGEVLDLMEFRLNGTLLEATQLPSDDQGFEVFEVVVNEGGLLSITPKTADLANLPSLAFNTLSTRALSISGDERTSLRSATNALALNAAAAPTGACAQAFAPYRASVMLDVIDTVALYNTCVNIHPKVHIVITDLWSANNTVVYPFEVNTLPLEGTGIYTLKTITDHAVATGSYAAINGYVWGPDSYFSKGLLIPIFQAGTPEGTQISAGQQLTSIAGTTFTEKEAIIGFKQKDANFGTEAAFFDKPAQSNPNLGAYNFNVVSSRASVVKNGVCTTTSAAPGALQLNSAVGITDDGFLVMVSSSSGNESTRYDLCQVFLALQANNAILLDGGTSTSIYVGGNLLNPLTGSRYIAAGSARKVVSIIGVQ